MFFETKVLHLLIGDLLTFFISFSHKMGFHCQPRGGFSSSDIFECSFKGIQRATSPIFTNFGKQAMFNGIPFGRTWWVMADIYRQSKLIAQLFLDFVFPYPGTTWVATPGISQYKQFVWNRIIFYPFSLPPTFNGFDGKSWGIMGGAQKDCARVHLRIVDAIWTDFSYGIW